MEMRRRYDGILFYISKWTLFDNTIYCYNISSPTKIDSQSFYLRTILRLQVKLNFELVPIIKGNYIHCEWLSKLATIHCKNVQENKVRCILAYLCPIVKPLNFRCNTINPSPAMKVLIIVKKSTSYGHRALADQGPGLYRKDWNSEICGELKTQRQLGRNWGAWVSTKQYERS